MNSSRLAERGRVDVGRDCRDASPVRVARFEYQSSKPARINFPRSARTRRARVARGRASPAKAFSRGKRKVQAAGAYGEGKEKVVVRIFPMEPGWRADLPAP